MTKTSDSDNEHTKILKLLDRFIEGLRTKNPDIWQDIFLEEGSHFAFRKTDAGDWIPNYRKPEEWLSILAIEERELDQNFWNPVIHIRGPIASVWSPYELFRDDKSSHCGIDSISLLKIKGEWKIFSFVATHEPGACKELRRERRPARRT